MKYKVLIVEDDQNYRYALGSMYNWEENGFQIAAEAIHGLQALDLLKKGSFDLVITDMSMPMMNGLELIRCMQETFPDLPVIVLSAYDDFPFVKESLKLGALDYILKQEMTAESIAKVIADAKSYLAKHKSSTENICSISSQLLFDQGNAETHITVPPEICMQFSSAAEFIHAQTRKICQTLPARSVVDHIYMSIYFDIIRKYTCLEDQEPELAALAQALTGKRLVLEKENCLLEHLRSFWQNHIVLLTGKTREITQTIEYIHTHYDEDLSLSVLSDHVSLSANYLSNLFKAETGENLTQYINRVRIEKARFLMNNTSLRVYEIAHAVGFHNPTYFSSIFRKTVGLSVMEYRKSKPFHEKSSCKSDSPMVKSE